MKADRLFACAAGGLAAAAFSLLPVTPRLVWNRTASMPVGLYVLSATPTLERGMIVAYAPSASEAAFLEAHRYTGRGWALVKRVAALEGDDVCLRGSHVTINGKLTATALVTDDAGRSLPELEGCRRLERGDAFLLGDHPRSMDGRYLGIARTDRILGKARLVWPTASLRTAAPEDAKRGESWIPEAVME